MKKIPELVKEHAELFIFFFFLITSLFLGDGKQPFVDVWWALGILMMYGVRYYQRGKLDLRPLPRFIGWAWAALILYYVILTPFSDSAGYSITATIRLVEAYLVYVMFATVSSDNTITLFIKGLLFVGVVATLASFVFLLVPSWAGFLPPMNLLYATYGHNHLADILLFVFPVAIGLVERKRGPASVGLLALFVVGMLLSFARGAWVLLVLYLVFLYLKNKSPYLKKIVLVGAVVIVAVFFAISLLSRNGASVVLAQKAPQLSRLIQKPSLLQDGRWEYWRQAIEAIKERPFFGSGPGTFYLQSKRLQARPNSYSWFVHSFPLETMVEVGFSGLLIYLFLICVLFREVLVDFVTRKNNRVTTLLLRGIVLVFIYSLYEFTLDYTVVWLLVWAAFGVLITPRVQKEGIRTNKSIVCLGALAVLAIFYFLAIASSAASVRGTPVLAAYLAPYDSTIAIEAIKYYSARNIPMPDRGYKMTRLFHGNNPLVLIELAELMAKIKKRVSANQLYKLVLQRDSQNTQYFLSYLSYLVDEADSHEILEETLVFEERYSATDKLIVQELIKEMPTNLPQLYRFKKMYLSQPPREPQEPFIAKVFYFIGLDFVDSNPMYASKLWRLAVDSDPTLSFYYAELASLYANKLDNMPEANAVLHRCLLVGPPRQHCRDLLGDNLPLRLNVPPVGYFSDTIQTFPLQ